MRRASSVSYHGLVRTLNKAYKVEAIMRVRILVFVKKIVEIDFSSFWYLDYVILFNICAIDACLKEAQT